MGYLEKNFILHRRGEEGNLLPVDSFIEEFNSTIAMTPMSRGEFLDVKQEALNCGEELDKKRLLWENLIVKHSVNPKFTLEEVQSMKMVIKKFIVKDQDKKGKETEKTLKLPMDPFDIFVENLYKISGADADPEKDLKKN